MRGVRWLLSTQNLCAGVTWRSGVEPYKSQLLRMVHSSSPPDPPDLPDTKPTPTTRTSSALTTFEAAFDKEQRNKASFVQVLDTFCSRDVRRRGHVEMIDAALRWMPKFGVQKDLEVYNKLLDVFPKEVFVPRNFIQTLFNHYPRQQECALRVLEQMEIHGVTPNKHTCFLLTQTFGKLSHPIKKYRRMMYWFPRFKHINPYFFPDDIVSDPVALSKVCLERIAADKDARLTVYQLPSTEVLDNGAVVERTHLIGIQSPEQASQLSKHNACYPILVEGPFPLWVKKTCVHYYILRGEPGAVEKEELDPERCFYYPLFLDLDLERDLGDDDSFDVDEVEEGPVYAMCMTGSEDEQSLRKWIQGLQETNPALGDLTVLFRLSSGAHQGEVPKKEQSDEATEEEEEAGQPERRRMEQ